jgi:uncharacterized Tic20 family protein
MEKKFLGGRIDKKLFFTLCWALTSFIGVGFILAIVSLVMDKEQSVEEKRENVAVIVATAVMCVGSFTVLIPLYVFVCGIIAAVKAYKGETFQIPGVYHIAKLIIK